MYAQKLIIEVIVDGKRQACPLDWLDNFSMRDFTRDAEFDDTLPIADGLLEAGNRVDLERLEAALGAWLTKRGKAGGQPVRVEVHKAKVPPS
jgi:hypothetical protein